MIGSRLFVLIFCCLLISSSINVIAGIIKESIPTDNDPIQPPEGGTACVIGDWNVTDIKEYHNCTIVVSGNLTIKSGGTLTLHNVTLIMNCTMNGEYFIEVQNGGAFYIHDHDLDALTTYDCSSVTSPNPSYHYYFRVKDGSTFEMINSELHECGVFFGAGSDGLSIENDGCVLINSTFSNNYYGFHVYLASNLTLTDCEVFNNTWGGMFIEQSSNISLTRCIVTEGNATASDSGIRFSRSDDIGVTDCNVSDYDVGLSISRCRNLTCNVNKMWNNTGNGFYIYGIEKDHYNHTMPTSNTINDKSLHYYFLNKDTIIQDIDSGHMELAFCDNVTLFNCSVINADYIALDYTNESKINYCNLSGGRNGVRIQQSSHNNKVQNSNFTNMLASAIEIVNGASNNLISNCEISPGIGKTGIYMNNNKAGGYNTIKDSNLTNLNLGVDLFSTPNTIVDNCYIDSLWLAIRLIDSNHTEVFNSTVIDKGFPNIQLTSDSHLTLINTSYQKNNVIFQDAQSNLTVQWFANIYVNNSLGNPINNANLWINNTENGTKDSVFGLTNGFGWLNWTRCTEYISNDTNGDTFDQTPGERIYFTPHNFTAIKFSMVGYNNTIMNISKVVNIVFVDDIPPSADSYAPIGLAVPINSDIIVQWNDSMDWTSVENSFTYTDGITIWDSMDGSWAYDNMTLTSTFTPTVPFDFDTQYWVEINITATDVAGNPLDQDKDGSGGEWPEDVLYWTFTTALNSPPTITISTPSSSSDWTGNTLHDVWWNCTDTEDKATDSLTIFLNYTSVQAGNGTIAGPLLNETDRPHTWNTPLIDATDVVVNATVIDSDGMKGWFDTAPFTLDSTAPELASTSPANNSIDIPITTTVVLTFNESMNEAETQAAFTLENDTATVAGNFGWDPTSTVMTFTPSQLLALNTTYWANVTTAAEDDSDSGNALESFNSTNFKTIAEPDTTGPAVTSGPTIEPSPVHADGIHDTYIWLNATVSDTNLGNSTIAAAEMILWNETAPTISGGFSIPMDPIDGTFDEITEEVTIGLHGFANMPAMTLYYWVHGQDSEGNWGPWKFVTLEIIDKKPPKVTYEIPWGSEVMVNKTISISFNEDMDKASVEAGFSISPSISGSFSWPLNDTVVFTPSSNMSINTTYTACLNGSIAKDLAGNTLDGNENGIAEGSPIDDYSWSFTTWLDTDLDGIPDSTDTDDDNDGVPDDEDAFPLDPTESVDTDDDGIGNNADTDDDGDGVPDDEDLDPLDPSITTDTTPPSTPSGLTLTVQDNGVLVEWTAIADSDLHHYAIYRSTDNVTFERIINVSAGTTSYLDTAVTDGTTYYYKITAVDDNDNESPFSSTMYVIWSISIIDTPTDYAIYIVAFVIVVILLLISAMFIKKRKKPEDEEVVEEQEEVVEDTDKSRT